MDLDPTNFLNIKPFIERKLLERPHELSVDYAWESSEYMATQYEDTHNQSMLFFCAVEMDASIMNCEL